MRKFVIFFWLLICFLVTIYAVDDDCNCESVLKKIDSLPPPKDTSKACKRLAKYVVEKRSTPFSKKIDTVPQSILQPAEARPSGSQGSSGQTNAIPSIEPEALMGGSIALAGTGKGTQAVTAISINPAMFSKQSDKSFAELSRFGDFTVLLPVSLFQEDAQSGLNFFGVNARINFVGPSEGKELFENQKKQIEQVLNKALNADAGDLKYAEKMLKGSSDVCGCSDALLADSADAEKIKKNCGQTFASSSSKIYEEIQRLTIQAQQSADSRYFGLDMRFWHSIKTDSGSLTSLFLGLAGGKKLGTGELSSFSLRGWLGAQYVDSGTALPAFAANGAVGFVINRTIGPQSIQVAMGIEGRGQFSAKNDSNTTTLPNMALIRASVSIPFLAGSGLSISGAFPIYGDEKPIINVGYNWSLQLPDNLKNFTNKISNSE